MKEKTDIKSLIETEETHLNNLLDSKDLDSFKGMVNELRDTCCLLYTSPSPRDRTRSRMPSSA